jgi:bifunctional non-homologous end joining protein LigD
MKNCVRLKPELVAQIEFTEWTPDGHLRPSKRTGIREDKGAKDVAREG